MQNTLLSANQLSQYRDQGFLLLSGLIPADLAQKAEAAMWRHMEMDQNDPSSWQHHPANAEFDPERGLAVFNGLQDPELLACATPLYLQANADLLGRDAVHPPQAVHTQNKLPVAGEWHWPKPHVDGIPKEHMHKTFPGPYDIASLVFLNDVPPHGGGTAVWPGSHKKIRALAESDRKKYQHLYHLNMDIPSLDLGEPIELTPKRGDVLFFQPLFGHNGSPNTSATPRWMMRYFCGCSPCFNRWKKTDSWGLWSP